jgi:hypothetical protein
MKREDHELQSSEDRTVTRPVGFNSTQICHDQTPERAAMPTLAAMQQTRSNHARESFLLDTADNACIE